MKMNRKGDIGFPEAMMAVMLVTLVLMAYLVVFAYNNDGHDDADPDFDRDIVEYITIENGIAKGDLTDAMQGYLEHNNYRGITILCHIPGELAVCELTFMVGDMDGDIFSERFVKSIGSNGGEVIPMVFEVGICI